MVNLYRLLAPVLLSLVVCACAPKHTVVTPQLQAQMTDDLKSGRLTLTCQFQCDWSWLTNFQRMIALHNAKQWTPLAELVMQVGHEKDIAYYFLGRSAEGLEYQDAAAKYYQRSQELFADATSLHHCRSLENGCAGVDLASVLPIRIATVQPAMESRGSANYIATQDAASLTGKDASASPKNLSRGKGVTPITEELLKNLALKVSGEISEFEIPFKNGHFVEGEPSTPEYIEADIMYSTVGNLTGDNVNDGVAITAYNTGGSGIEYSVCAVIAAPGNPIVTNSSYLGDRPEIKSLKINSGKFIINALVQGENDGACCPSQKSTLIYAIKDGRLSKFSGSRGRIEEYLHGNDTGRSGIK